MQRSGTPEPAGAERGPVQAEVQRRETLDGETLALTRVRARDREAARGPAVLVHGTYANRSFWMRDEDVGLAPFLAREGFDVWVPELRGHGRSPKPDDFAAVTAEDHIRRDLPTVQRAVREEGDRAPVWVGHSAGGLYLLAALSRGWIDPGDVAAVAVFGTQLSEGEAYLENRWIAGAIQGLVGLLGRLPSPWLGLGPEVEPAGEVNELIDWKKAGRWADRSGVSYREGLADLDVPLRAYAGADDTTDPPEGCRRLFEAVGSGAKSFQLLSEGEGFARDYGHVDMIASRAASRDVWPDLRAWIAEQA